MVAKSKRAGEDTLRVYEPELRRRDISLIIVSGDAIEGTITPRLLERSNPGVIAERRREKNGLPTVAEFATAITDAAMDESLESGHTVFVGSTDW